LIDLRLSCYRNSSLTPRTNGHPGVRTRSFEEPFCQSSCPETSQARINGVDFGKGGRIMITREERLSQQHAKSSPLFSTQYVSLPYPSPCHNHKSTTDVSCAAPNSHPRQSYQELLNMQLSLKASAPHILQQTIPLCQSVQRIVALAHRSYEAAKCVDLALSSESAVLIDFAN
jgi:hypothetical protein